MTFENFSEDDGSNDTKPQGTHLYFYERGHERLPGDEGDDRYEQIAEAFEYAKTKPDGLVRRFADVTLEGGMQQFLAQYVIAAGEALEEGDLSILVEHSLQYDDSDAAARAIARYLDDNEDVFQELVELMNSSEVKAESDGEEPSAAAKAND